MATLYVRNTSSNTAPYDTWAKAATTLGTAVAAASAGDTIWVSQAHTETTAASTLSLTFPTTPGLLVLCGNDGTEPPTAVTTGAQVTRTTTSDIDFVSGYAYIYGITFTAGSGAVTRGFHLGSNAANAATMGLIFDNCTFSAPGTTGSTFNVGPIQGGTAKGYTVMVRNSSVSFGAAAGTVKLQAGRNFLQNFSVASGSTTPTTLFTTVNGHPGTTIIEASDLSGKNPTNFISITGDAPADIIFRNCKLPTFTNFTTGTNPDPGAVRVKLHNCDSANTNYNYFEGDAQGTVQDETTIVRTGGASDGVTGLSWKMASSSTTVTTFPLVSNEIVIYNKTVGSSVTATVEIISDNASNINNNDIWLEVQYLSNSTRPLSSFASSFPTDVVQSGTAVTASSATWTTTGLTNPNKQKMQVTFTPQQVGYIHAIVKLAKASYTVYVDPVITLS